MTSGHIGVGGSRLVQPDWPGAREHLSRVDPVMKRLIAAVGEAPEIHVVDDPWEAVVRGIRHNMVNAKVAYRYVDTLVTMFGGHFPSPQEVLAVGADRLQTEGRMPRNQANSIISIATAIVAGELDFRALGDLNDADLKARLFELKGVKTWTSAMLMLFHYQRQNVVITGDVGLRSAFREEYGLPDTLSEAEVDARLRRHAETVWAPHASAAAYYLWKSHGAFVPGLSGVNLPNTADLEKGPTPDAVAVVVASKKRTKTSKVSK